MLYRLQRPTGHYLGFLILCYVVFLTSFPDHDGVWPVDAALEKSALFHFDQAHIHAVKHRIGQTNKNLA